MKRPIRVICLILVLSLMMAVPAQAAGEAEPRGSAYFSSYCTYLSKMSDTSLAICFDVDANAAFMDELGASQIELYESKDQQHWTRIKIYEPGAFPYMLAYNTTSHADYVMYYNALPGYYYTACVTYYAKKGNGIGENFIYTQILRM